MQCGRAALYRFGTWLGRRRGRAEEVVPVLKRPHQHEDSDLAEEGDRSPTEGIPSIATLLLHGRTWLSARDVPSSTSLRV